MVHTPEVPQAPQGVRGGRRLTRHVPLAERRRARHLGPDLGTSSHRDAARRRRIGVLAVAIVVRGRPAGTAVHLHVLSEARGVGVGLVATGYAAVVGFVGRVDVGVLLAIG